jgi:hypothetical protein
MRESTMAEDMSRRRTMTLAALAACALGLGITLQVSAEGPPEGEAKAGGEAPGEHAEGEHAEAHDGPYVDASAGPVKPDDYDKMMSVLEHKRCTNCHPSDGIPKQGEDSHPHYFDMARGKQGMGYEATNCNTCHQAANNPYSGVPGAPSWSLAPHSMRWEGLSRDEIAASMLDPARNGGRSHTDLVHHLTEHELVLWAWAPGVDARGRAREVPPVPKDEYIAAVKRWFAAGAVIPKK